MIENDIAAKPTLALTRDVLSRIAFGKPLLEEYDRQPPSGGRRIKATVPILLDGRRIGTAKIDLRVYTPDAPNSQAMDQLRQFGYAMVRPRGSEEIEWEVEVAESRDREDSSLEQATRQILAAARRQVDESRTP
jgi:hypothetical protein